MQTKKITFCAAMAALAVVFMLAAYFPYITYAVACMASLPIMVVLIEFNKRWAFLTYIVSLLPIFIFCETESKLIYLCFTGFYPILKVFIEKLNNKILEYIVKILSFNSALAVIYFIASFLFKISYSDLGELGKYGAFVFVILANAVFVCFDFCISKIAVYYIYRIHPAIDKILR